MFIYMDEKYPVNYSTVYSAFLRRGADALQAVEAEIRREKAEALGWAGDRLEDALNGLERAREAVGVRIHLDVERSYKVPERLG